MMSQSENISLWKKKSEIDYIPLFMSLWLSLNAWMKDRFTVSRDRDLVDLLKNGGPLKDKFSELMSQTNANAERFKGNFAELHRALENAHIPYGHQPASFVGFENCIVSWNDGNYEFESILKMARQQHKIKIDEGLWVDDNNTRLFAAYIEILYQIRCALFHGDLPPKPENERVIKQLYITLSMIMVSV